MQASEVYGDNQSLGERTHDALVKAGGLKGEALRCERMYKRKRRQHFLHQKGSVAERDALVSEIGDVQADENAWIAAETAWNIAKAEADGLHIRFNEWQTENATRRAEMNIR